MHTFVTFCFYASVRVPEQVFQSFLSEKTNNVTNGEYLESHDTELYKRIGRQ